MLRILACLVLATVAGITGGCVTKDGVSNRTRLPTALKPGVQDANLEYLLAKYNTTAAGSETLNATVELKPTAGSKYSGLIEEYHEVKAFLLAERPAQIRMIGQAPVIGKTVFDMTSDGETFRVSIPTKNKFLVGSVAQERASTKPIENLRPQHLLDALLWPEIQKKATVLFEEFNDEHGRYYILTVLRGGYQTEIQRKIWFDRADLQVARLQSFGPKGILVSDVRVEDWQPVDVSASDVAKISSALTFPRVIRIIRPHDDYLLDLLVLKITLNEDIPADRFKLDQPPGSELVQVGEGTDATARDSKP